MLHIGGDYSSLLNIVDDAYNYSFTAVDPQTNFFGTTAKVTIACQGASMGHFTAYRQKQSGRLLLADLAQIWVCFSGFPES